MRLDGTEDFRAAAFRVGCNHHGRPVKRRQCPVRAAYGAAGFEQDEHRGGIVPRLELPLKIELNPAGGEVAYLQRRRAEAPHIVATQIDVEYDVGAEFSPLLVIGAHRCAEDAVFERTGGNPYRPAVEEGPFSPLGGEELSPPGTVYDP